MNPNAKLGCQEQSGASDCESRGCWFEPRSSHILSLRFGHEKNLYDHSHPSADSRSAVVSYWKKNGH